MSIKHGAYINYKKKDNYQENEVIIDYLAKLPLGKYENFTLQEVMELDPGYYTWMCFKKLPFKWGLYRPKIKQIPLV